MTVSRAAACLMLCLTTFCVRADVLLTPHPRGLIDVAFSDGLKTELSPGVQGQGWADTDCFGAFMLAGSGADLFHDGQTIRLPIPYTDHKVLDCFGQFKPDDKDPKAIHFLYRFTAPEATSIYSARVQLRMLAKDWGGAALAAINGAGCAPALSVKPYDMRPFNAQAGGLIVAAGTPHEVRMELDAPHWMCVNDERTWGGGGWGDSFSIDLYALVADGGTPVTAGQVMEIAGTFHFAEPVEVFEPQPIVAKVSDATGWKAALGLGVADVFGKELGLAPSMRMGVADDAPGVIEYTGQILDEPSKKPQFDVVRRVTVADDKSEMLVSQQLTALGVLRIQGVYSQVRLPRPQFDGCKAIFLNQGQPSVVLRDYTRPTSAIARAAAPSVRIDSTGGPLLTVTCKTATYWEMRVQPDAFVLCASFFEPILFVDMSRPVPKATTLREDLTIHWGK